MFVLQKGFLSLEKLLLVLTYEVGQIQKFHSDNKDKCYRQNRRFSYLCTDQPIYW